MEGTMGDLKQKARAPGLGGSISLSTVTHAIREACVLNNSPT